MGSKTNSVPHSAGRWEKEQLVGFKQMAILIDRLAGRMAEAGFEERDVFSVRLGVEEAIVNAIRHGNRCDPSKKVHVRYHIEPGKTLIQVEDEGSGFDPDKVPDPLAPENLERPGGRGVFLIHNYMTRVEYNKKGNCVTLCKERSA